MTSTSGATLQRRQNVGSAPFAIALGFALATSPAVGVVPSPFQWTTTPVMGSPSQARASDPAAPSDLTSSGVPRTRGSRGDGTSLSPAQRIAELRALSGLTIDQVSRLFGVSRRSVHNWVNGNAMAQLHEERAAKILAIVQALPGSTPAERRAALLDSSRGASLFHQLIGAREEGARLQVPGLSVRERLYE